MPKHPLKKLPPEVFESIALRFRALSELSRLKIVEALQSGEKNVTELVELTELSQSNVSRHLNILVSAGLVSRKKDGLNMLYRISDSTLLDLCALMCRSVKEK